jgi:hypothetical protein
MKSAQGGIAERVSSLVAAHKKDAGEVDEDELDAKAKKTNPVCRVLCS